MPNFDNDVSQRELCGDLLESDHAERTMSAGDCLQVRNHTNQTIRTVQTDRTIKTLDAASEASHQLYKNLSAALEFHIRNEKKNDRFSAIPASQLVLACSCSSDSTAYPPYLIVQVTPELVRTVKSAMDLCQQHGLLEVKLAIPSAFSWAPVHDDGSTESSMCFAKMGVTKDDFCISEGMHHDGCVVCSVDVSFKDLLQHIKSGASETLFFNGEDAEEQSLREQLADDRADALVDFADTSRETGESNADLPQG